MLDTSELTTVAVRIAEKNVEIEPNLTEIFLFPDEDQQEIRMIEIDPLAIPSEDRIEPFYFARDPVRGLPFRLAVAMIRPEEKGVIEPPEEWGGWDKAVRIWPKGDDEAPKPAVP